jgi:hypothetical protein
VRRELIGLFAPPKQLAQAGLIAAGLSCVTLFLRWDSLPLTALSLSLAWWFSGSFVHIAIQPISYWDRAWPVPHWLLLRTRILAAWLASWVPMLALVVTASALHGLGLVGEIVWLRTLSIALCLLGLVPLACATSHRLSNRPAGSPTHVASLLLVPAFALETSVTVSGLDSKSLAALLAPALLVGMLALAIGVLLTRAWVEAPELESAPARQRESKAARPAADVAGKSAWRGVLCGPLAYFFLHSPALALIPVLNLLVLGALRHFHYQGIMWMASTMLWLQAYGGSFQPGPLPAHLPISRQRILGYLVAPLAMLVATGLAFQYLWPDPTRLSGFSVERYALDPDGAELEVNELHRIVAPSFVWRASWGEPPLITTPEGMSRRPAAFAVLPGLPLSVYNPYDALLNDDPGFVNYQASRIMSRLLHMDVSAADIEGACHAVQLNRMTKDCLRAQFGNSYERPRMWPPVESWFLCIMVLINLQLETGGRFSRAKPFKVLSLVWYLPMLFGLPFVLDEVGKQNATGVPSFPFRLAAVLGQLTEFVDRAPLASSIVGLALLFGFYRHVERRFARMDGFSRRGSVARVRSSR